MGGDEGRKKLSTLSLIAVAFFWVPGRYLRREMRGIY